MNAMRLSSFQQVVRSIITSLQLQPHNDYVTHAHQINTHIGDCGAAMEWRSNYTSHIFIMKLLYTKHLYTDQLVRTSTASHNSW